jgi:hypothetical protein
MSKHTLHIGQVKWFGDKRRSINYGFIFTPGKDDTYFTAESLNSAAPPLAGDLVCFWLKDNSTNTRSSLQNTVQPLESIDDISLLYSAIRQVALDENYADTKEKYIILLFKQLEQVLHLSTNSPLEHNSLDSDTRNAIYKTTLKSSESYVVSLFTLLRSLYGEESAHDTLKTYSVTSTKIILWLGDVLLIQDPDEARSLISSTDVNNTFRVAHKYLTCALRGHFAINHTDLEYVMSYCLSISNKATLTSRELSLLFIIRSVLLFLSITTFKHSLFIFFDELLSLVSLEQSPFRLEHFFDHCEGRMYLQEYPAQSPQLRLSKGPKESKFCDGRKSPKGDERNNCAMWWCQNQRCYQPSRSNKETSDISLLTVPKLARLIGVDLDDEEYGIYLGVVNKLNRYLERLECKACNLIMRPVRQTNYAAERVNTFTCTSELCSQRGALVYLSQCLNKYCDNVVDSRISARCTGDKEQHINGGWYICDKCFACCDNERIHKRMDVYHLMGLTKGARPAIQSHHSANVVCCYKCGGILQSMQHKADHYESIARWLQERKNDTSLFSKTGIGWSGRRWYLMSRGDWGAVFDDKVRALYEAGFDVPSIGDHSAQTQLISEAKLVVHGGIGMMCEACGTLYDDGDNVPRIKAVRNYRENMEWPAKKTLVPQRLVDSCKREK